MKSAKQMKRLAEEANKPKFTFSREDAAKAKALIPAKHGPALQAAVAEALARERHWERGRCVGVVRAAQSVCDESGDNTSWAALAFVASMIEATPRSPTSEDKTNE